MNVLNYARSSKNFGAISGTTRNLCRNQHRSFLLKSPKLAPQITRVNKKFSRNFCVEHDKEGEKLAEEVNQPPKESPTEKDHKDQKEQKDSPQESPTEKDQKEQKEQKDPKDEKITQLEELLVETRKNYRSALAETENVMKRMQLQVDKAREYGVEKLVKNIFQITDTLNVCIQNKPNFSDPTVGENKLAKSAFEGLELTKKQIEGILRDNYSIEEFFPQKGETFDPMKHDALFEVDAPSPNIVPGQIGLIIKSGWKRKEILLRAAGVGVVKQKKPQPEETKPVPEQPPKEEINSEKKETQEEKKSEPEM